MTLKKRCADAFNASHEKKQSTPTIPHDMQAPSLSLEDQPLISHGYKPIIIYEGLAIYGIGSTLGGPVLLFPGPHRFQQPGDGSAGPLIEGLVHHGLGRQVISFDPPGSGHSTRPPKLSMEEMLECANETLKLLQITKPIDIFGHSMGGLCALAYALQQSQSHATNNNSEHNCGTVKRVVLVGTGSGGTAYMKAPGALWNATHAAFWKMALLGVLQMVYQCKALQNIMLNFIDHHSYVDRQRWFVPRPIRRRDWFRRKSGHSEWHAIAKNLNIGMS